MVRPPPLCWTLLPQDQELIRTRLKPLHRAWPMWLRGRGYNPRVTHSPDARRRWERNSITCAIFGTDAHQE